MQKEGRAFLLEEPWPPSMTPDQYNSMTSGYFSAIHHVLAALDIYNFYAQNHSDPNDHYFWIEQYDQLFSDIAFNVPLVERELPDLR
ncbi:unnamed protein product, partial [Mesorhabditis belari]|uniref:Uncharacterized protein n=1 Tax=Mesorhabditis belari TaxID=2138241 RepID=A0AAF3F6X2_9BILA